MAAYDHDKHYWDRVRKAALAIESDGCTGVPDFHVDCCFEHDIAYVSGHTVDLERRTKWQADRDFRHCLQARSRWGVFSPMSWWRWIAVTLCGRGIWATQGKGPTRRVFGRGARPT